MAIAQPFGRYLGILGLAAGPPDLDHLRALVAAQLVRVPFENVSKLYLKKRFGATSAPTLEEHLDGIERFGFGGTCYANNPHFYALLRQLGYDVALCGADMSRPDVHVVSIVRLGGREHLVDVGYAAPFYGPLPRDLESDLEIRFGESRYILSPRDEAGRSRLVVSRGGRNLHGYLAKPTAREIGEFQAVIADSYRETATFMNAVVVERFFPGRSVRIHNLSLTESTPDGATTTPLNDREDLIQAIEAHAGIPADIVREATEGVRLDGEIYG
jgi:arylamine N-acetyltransferase